jgi:GTPase SAR1 family protein
MIRQFHIFYKGDRIYNYSYAIGLSDEDLNNIKKIFQSYIDMPISGKIFQRPVSEKFQFFHKSEKNTLFLIIADLTDQIEYIKDIFNKIMPKFNILFPDPSNIYLESEKKLELDLLLKEIQYDLHSKITIIGPFNAGKTTLYNLLRSNSEKLIMNFAKSSLFKIDTLKFDIWDFQLDDNFSLLWSKFISGSDLIIFLFDLSNYHLKVIDHFLNLIKQESKFSKVIVLGNKRDLVEEIDIKIISNELNLPFFEEISLIHDNAKEQLFFLISKVLALRELLPKNFKNSIKDAIDTENEGKLVLAIAKYKELIKICNQYQDFTYLDIFKQKVNELQNMIDKQSERRRAEESRKKFEVPGKIIFTKKVLVKPLPASESEITAPSIEIPKAPKKSESESEYKKIAEDLTLFNKEEKSQQSKKDAWSPIDIKADFKVIAPIETTRSQEEVSNYLNFPKTLQSLIEQKGSSLSLKLCEQLVSELQNTLARNLTIDDIQMAADVFVKQESSTI